MRAPIDGSEAPTTTPMEPIAARPASSHLLRRRSERAVGTAMRRA
jgi:hypothetical protein